MKKNVLIFLVCLGFTYVLHAQIIGDLGHTPPKSHWFVDNYYVTTTEEQMYCLINNNDFISNPTDGFDGDMNMIYANTANVDIMILFTSEIPEGSTYAIFGTKYVFANIVGSRIRIPDDLPSEDQIRPHLYNGKMVKGGIIRNVPHDDYATQVRVTTPAATGNSHRAIDIIVSTNLPGVMTNPAPAGYENPTYTEYPESPIVNYPTLTSVQTNYVVSIKPRKEVTSAKYTNNILTLNGVTSSDAADALVDIQYLDGLGRPIEMVQRGRSTSRKDIISIREYDNYGREDRTWLPGTGSTNSGAYVKPNTVMDTSKSVNNDTKPYSRVLYEPTNSGRPFSQYNPGNDWHSNKKALRNAYNANIQNNDSLNCIYYRATSLKSDTTIIIIRENEYENGELQVTRSTDEDGNLAFQFTDKAGRVVLIRQVLTNGSSRSFLDTYNIYDNFGNWVAVLPPQASDAMKTGSSWSNTGSGNNVLRDYAYLYVYDSRNRQIAKRIPGANWIYYIYDRADRLIFTQDGEQRSKNPQEWTFSIPDVFGKIALTGICRNSLNVFSHTVTTNLVKASWSTQGSAAYKGYTISGLTLTDAKTHTANFYDSYTFAGAANTGIPALGFTAVSGYGTQYTGGSQGLLTGSLSLVLDDNAIDKYLYSIMYYDNRGRVVQTKSSYETNGSGAYSGTEEEYIAYNFSGAPIKRMLKHIKGTEVAIEHYAYTYDHAGRLTQTKHSLSNSVSTVPSFAPGNQYLR